LLETTDFYTEEKKYEGTQRLRHELTLHFMLRIDVKKKITDSCSESQYYMFRPVIYEENKSDLSPNTCMTLLPLYSSRSCSDVTTGILMLHNRSEPRLPPPAQSAKTAVLHIVAGPCQVVR
jgi:hypothetical protein